MNEHYVRRRVLSRVTYVHMTNIRKIVLLQDDRVIFCALKLYIPLQILKYVLRPWFNLKLYLVLKFKSTLAVKVIVNLSCIHVILCTLRPDRKLQVTISS